MRHRLCIWQYQRGLFSALSIFSPLIFSWSLIRESELVPIFVVVFAKKDDSRCLCGWEKNVAKIDFYSPFFLDFFPSQSGPCLQIRFRLFASYFSWNIIFGSIRSPSIRKSINMKHNTWRSFRGISFYPHILPPCLVPRFLSRKTEPWDYGSKMARVIFGIFSSWFRKKESLSLPFSLAGGNWYQTKGKVGRNEGEKSPDNAQREQEQRKVRKERMNINFLFPDSIILFFFSLLLAPHSAEKKSIFFLRIDGSSFNCDLETHPILALKRLKCDNSDHLRLGEHLLTLPHIWHMSTGSGSRELSFLFSHFCEIGSAFLARNFLLSPFYHSFPKCKKMHLKSERTLLFSCLAFYEELPEVNQAFILRNCSLKMSGRRAASLNS